MLLKIILIIVLFILAFCNVTYVNKKTQKEWDSQDHPILRIGAVSLLAVILYPLIFNWQLLATGI